MGYRKIEICIESRISKYLCTAQRYDNFKLIIDKFKKPSKTAVVLIAGVTIYGTPCPRHITVHLVPNQLRAIWPRPEQSHLLPEACSPNGTDNARDEQSVLHPNPATFLKDFTLYITSNDAIS